MGLLDRLFGKDATRAPRPEPASQAPVSNQQAIQRYRYMVRTAPPEALEQAQAEAFARLTPEQRRNIHAELTSVTPEAERGALAGAANDSRALARIATRAEIRQPGFMERALGGFGGGLLTSFAAAFAGTMVAQSFFSALSPEAHGATAADDGLSDQGSEAESDWSGSGHDGGDFGGGDDFGGDFGGGDF
jgi:hypothetical protein